MSLSHFRILFPNRPVLAGSQVSYSVSRRVTFLTYETGQLYLLGLLRGLPRLGKAKDGRKEQKTTRVTTRTKCLPQDVP